MAFVYLDIEGNELDKSQWDEHHVIPQCKAKNRKARDFINQRGLVLPVLRVCHNEGKEALHNNVGFPPMPSVMLRHRINQYTDQLHEPNVYDRFIGIAEFVGDLAVTTGNTDIRKQCERLSANFAQQMPFILLGQIERVEVS